MDQNSIRQKIKENILRSEELKQDKTEFWENTFCQTFHKTAERYPEAVAVTDEKHTITYRELEGYSNFLAHHLLRNSVEVEDIIAIQAGRHVQSVVAMLAVWKAGAAYVFLDDCYPEARNERLKAECQYHIVIDDAYLEDLDWRLDTEYIDRSERERLAIVIYTSGSTSMPKGVMIEHRNVMAAISNFDRFGFCESDRTSVFASFSFVASVFDIFGSLSVGASLYVIPEYRRRSIELIMEFGEENHITVTFLPPHMAMKLMQYEDRNPELRLLLVGSESVRNLCPMHYRILNVYAASEMCSLISVYEIMTQEKTYPIGTLNPTVRGYIVDEHGDEVCPGGEGELWLSGPQVTRGYFKRPELTASQYMKNPFSEEKEYERVFKTRDLVRMSGDGNLIYITRKDHMYKIRGFRVESGAVESAILKCSAIKEVVVKAFEDAGGCNILCGYFVSDEDVDVKKLKERLKEIIPYYMVPTAMIRMEQLPRNFNNKIDRNALKAPKELNDYKLLKKLY